MSGFVCIVNFDGTEVDPRLLGRMTASMRFRGPDRQSVHLASYVGLGHALLRTSDGAEDDVQPCTLDGRFWIVADARIDAREELVENLVESGEAATISEQDATLLLRAYRAWGPRCVERELGDFAFVIWDAEQRRLFCARDQLGVKSLFYAALGPTVIISNTLGTVKLHSRVSDDLNDDAIADFLLFDVNQDPASTVFRDVRRVPPAHYGVFDSAANAVHRYWTMPIDEPLFYRREVDYLDRFHELIDTSVSDRLRSKRMGLYMSGGVDSTTLAAVASRAFRRRGLPNGVRAYTVAVEGFDHDESRYARLVAKHLDIPITVIEGGVSAYDENWSKRRQYTTGPVCDLHRRAFDRDLCSQIAKHSRVCFYGEGPDNALAYEWEQYLTYLVRGGRYVRLCTDVVRHMKSHRRGPLSFLQARLARRIRRRYSAEPVYPEWLEPAFEHRCRLRERWNEVHYGATAEIVHPVRPVAYRSFTGPLWESLFREFDPEETRVALDVRHPFLDLRVLRYLLSVPPVPWCRRKLLIRRAMKGSLPNIILRRPKSPLMGDPDYEASRSRRVPDFIVTPQLERYVRPAAVPPWTEVPRDRFWDHLRPRALNYWLMNQTH